MSREISVLNHKEYNSSNSPTALKGQINSVATQNNIEDGQQLDTQ